MLSGEKSDVELRHLRQPTIGVDGATKYKFYPFFDNDFGVVAFRHEPGIADREE